MAAPRAGTAEIVRYLMDQHGLTRADMVPILGTASRVSEVLRGKKGLSMTMVQRLRARFGVPADLLLPPAKKSARKAGKKEGGVRRKRARKAVTYSAGEIGRVRVVENFLPSPDALVPRPSGLMLRSAPEERISKHGTPHPPRRRAPRGSSK